MTLDESIQTLEHRPAAYVSYCLPMEHIVKGSAHDLVERMKPHKAGKVSRTRNRRPLSLLHFEYFENYTDACKRENYFKSGAGREGVRSRYP